MLAERVARLEAQTEGLRIDVSEIKTDLRNMLYGGMAAVVLLASLIGGSYFFIISAEDSLSGEIGSVKELISSGNGVSPN